MLKALGWIIKLCAFSALVLAAGNWVRWDGKTLSEQVGAAMTRAERSEAAAKARAWTRELTRDASEGASKKNRQRANGGRAPITLTRNDEAGADRTPVSAAAPAREHGMSRAAQPSKAAGSDGSAEPNDEIAASERQKLRALIRELNGAAPR